MPSFEVLCVTMHQKNFSKVKEMNIHSDVVFANQCDHTSYEIYEFEKYTAKMISTTTRGVGINRNLTLMYATADICLLADDDVEYYDDMKERIIEEFENNPKADIIIFHFDTEDKERYQKKYYETKKWFKWRGLPFGGIRIAFRLKSVQRSNVWFSRLFGGGAVFPSGEDSMFLNDLQELGLKIYVSKETIGKVSFESSTWFTGYDSKYFKGKGAYYGATKKKFAFLWMVYFALKIKKTNLSFFRKIKELRQGYINYFKYR